MSFYCCCGFQLPTHKVVKAPFAHSPVIRPGGGTRQSGVHRTLLVLRGLGPVIAYSLIFSGDCPLFLFVLLAIASLVLPVVAKKHRVKRGRQGKWMEITAIVIGGFNFYFVIFALTQLPDVVCYLGWVIGGIAYKCVAKKCINPDTEQSGDSSVCKAVKAEKKQRSRAAMLVISLIAACSVVVVLCAVIVVQNVRYQNKNEPLVEQSVSVEQELQTVPEVPEEVQEIAQSDPVADAAERVVYLEVYDSERACIGTASGFLVEDNTTLVTNYHVIQDAYSVTVWTQDQQSVEANTLLAYDEVADLAILRCGSGIEQEPLLMADSDAVRQGMQVYAVGYPLGLANTMSNGIISARYFDTYGNDILQTTAPVSDGNSGGPLLNEDGCVIGVVCAYYVDGQNLNIAIASNVLRQLLDQTEDLTALHDWDDRPLMPDQTCSEEQETEPEELPAEEPEPVMPVEPQNPNEMPELDAEKETDPESIQTSAPTGISLNLDYCFVAIGETVELVATVEPADPDTNIVWTSSDPERISVRDGLVSVIDTGNANAVITAQTENGLTAACNVIAKQNYLPCQAGGAGLVYTRYPEILSLENVTDPQEIGLWYEFVFEFNGTYYYCYQTRSSDMSEAFVMKYVAYLVENGYVLTNSDTGAFRFDFIDPTGAYNVHVRRENSPVHTVEVQIMPLG